MACGLLAVDCILEHWCLKLKAKRVPAGWRAPCPVCESSREISIQIKGGRPVWNRPKKPPCNCPEADVAAAIDGLVPCARKSVRGAGKHRRRADDSELISLVLDRTVPDLELRLHLLRMLGMRTADAVSKLGMSRSAYYRAVSALGQNRRSTLVPILGQFAYAK